MTMLKHIFLLIFLSATTAFAQNKKSLSLDDFTTKYSFSSQSIRNLTSMNDGEFYTSIVDKTKITKFNYKTGDTISVLFDLEKVTSPGFSEISKYTFSNTEKRILIETNPTPIYRRSYSATYFIWDIATQNLTPLSEKGEQQVATFSPDGERVAFIRDNNIFVKTIRFGTEAQVTTDGKKNEIINGIPDWVYEEEFEYNKAFEWSPDSKMLAFVKFNETDVPEFSMPMYKGLSPALPENSLYPGYKKFKYPKAGENNSIVSAHVFDIKTKTTIKMKIDDEKEYYLPKLVWTPDGNNLAIFKMNRRQNECIVLYANPNTGDTRTVITETNSRYIETDFLHQFAYLSDAKNFVVLSERDGWSHLYLYNNQGFKIKQITNGNFDVTNFYGYDAVNKVFYYQAAAVSPLQREVVGVSLDGKKQVSLSVKKGSNSANFSNNFHYFVNTYSSAKTPPQITVNDKKGNELRVLKDNKQLVEKLEQYNLPSNEFFTFKNKENIELNGYLLKPSDFNASTKYPVIMTQYSGPNSQSVTDSWKIDWHYFLAQQGFVVVCIDPRGTGFRGEEFRKCTYMQLGKLESDDQIDCAKYLSTLPFVDKDNIAIWGWSYGGFIAALCLEKGGSVFKAGIAVAPVTNWRFYDTVYTERYMRKPHENTDGYDDNSPITHPEGISGKLLLVHGTADDNVHAQNSYEFSEALVQAGVQFEMQIYTNRNHNIRGGKTTNHLHNKMLNFFVDNLK